MEGGSTPQGTMALFSLELDHIPWPLAYAPMAVQEVTLSQRQLSGRQVKLRTRDVHGPNWPLFWLLSHGHIR